jgi:hypothetical protein
MAAWKQGVNIVVLLFFVILGATIEVLGSLILGALVCVIPLVVFVMVSPTISRSDPISRSLRQSPLVLIAVIVCGSGFMVMIGASAGLDLGGILVGLVLFIVGLAVLAPRLQSLQRARGQPQPQAPSGLLLQSPGPTIPPAVYGQPLAALPPSPYPPVPQVAPPPVPYPSNLPSSPAGPSASATERYCPACGATNARTYTFCQKCGKPLPPSP